jgi:hypothetical protein
MALPDAKSKRAATTMATGLTDRTAAHILILYVTSPWRQENLTDSLMRMLNAYYDIIN